MVIGGLAAVVLVLTGESDSSSSAIAAPPRVQVAPISTEVEPFNIKRPAPVVPAVEDVAAIVERPLFVASRRPVANELPVAAVVERPRVVVDSAPPEPEMSFIGSLTRGNSVLALVTRGYYAQVESVGVGEEIDGWRVLSIDDRAIALGHGERRLEFRIFE